VVICYCKVISLLCYSYLFMGNTTRILTIIIKLYFIIFKHKREQIISFLTEMDNYSILFMGVGVSIGEGSH